ncbi:MAG: hypothetical protein ACI9MC_000513 [Kiritimatiellia bacterium]|jgi:hypothetical protein
MQLTTQDLANRFKAVLDEVEAGRIRTETQRKTRLAEARAARNELLAELVAFARAVGHLEISLGDDLLISWRGQRVRFSPVGDADRIAVAFEMVDQDPPSGDAHVRIYRHLDLGNRWVLSVPRGAREELEPLFDAGLVHLMTAGLGLPIPEASARTPQPDIDDLVASES